MSPRIEFDVRQEDDDVASSTIVRVVLASIAIAVFAVFLSGVLLRRKTGPILSSPAAHEAASSAGREIANIEQTPILGARDGLDLRREQREELSRYGWADRDAGIASIPIDQAIDLVVKEQR